MDSHLTPIRPYQWSLVLGAAFSETHLYRNICARPSALADGEVIAPLCRQVCHTLKIAVPVTDFNIKIYRAMA